MIQPTRPTATLRIAPSGALDNDPRQYLVSVELTLGTGTEATDFARATDVVVRSLQGVDAMPSPVVGPVVREVTTTIRAKDGTITNKLTGVEAEVHCAGWPASAALDGLCAALTEQGFRVTTEERRACSEPGCGEIVRVHHTRRDQAPASWYSGLICGRHNYRGCAGCQSVFRLVSSNAAGPAPSVQCEVCGATLVEWGGSKHWEVDLVTAGAPAK